MNIKEMHYDFKQKLNKIDSNQNRNLRVEEIDWLLNEAIEIFVKNLIFPKKSDKDTFEVVQKITDDVKSLVKTDYITTTDNKTLLPEDYWFFIEGKVSCRKNECSIDNGNLIIRSYYTDFEESPFTRTSFEWGEINGVFQENYIKTFVNDFTINGINLTYIKRHPYIHNAVSSMNGQYTDLKGNVLVGTQDCILDEHTHRKIVDIAVFLANTNLNNKDGIAVDQLKLKIDTIL